MEEFFSICPRDKKYLDYNLPNIPLTIVRNGIETTPDFKMNINKLNEGDRQFISQNGTGDSFKVTVIIHKDEKLSLSTMRKVMQEQRTTEFIPDVTETEFRDEAGNVMTLETLGYGGTLIADYLDPIEVMVESKEDVTITFLLDYFMRNSIPLYVISDVIGVNQTDLYLITENKSRKQEYKNYTVWDLTFTQYVEFQLSSFKNTNTGVTQAKEKYKNKTKSKVTDKQRLARCKDNWKKTLQFSKKKKVHNCVKYLQKILQKEGCYKPKKISGWYGVNTRKAIKCYQEKHKKDYGLKVIGKMDQQTFNALIGKPNQVGATKKIKSNLPKANKNGVVNVNVTEKNSAYSTVKVSNQKLTTTTKKKTVTPTSSIPKSTVTVTQPKKSNSSYVKLPKGTNVVNASKTVKSSKTVTIKKTTTKKK